MIWELQSAMNTEEDLAKVNGLLLDGWEPFSVTHVPRHTPLGRPLDKVVPQCMIFFRRRTR